MILTCPSCGTQYVVKDGAIPPEGRQVRCAACKHSWHQEPEDTLELQDEVEASPRHAEHEDPAVEAERAGDEGESLAEAALIDPRSGPEAEERAYEEAVIEGETDPAPEIAPPTEEVSRPASDWDRPPEAEPVPDMFSPFAGEDDEAPRGGALTKILIAALLIIVAAVAFWFLAPAHLKAKLGLAALDTTPLKVVTTHMDRQPLASGNSLLTLTGRVVNDSAREQPVPPLLAEIKTQDGRVVYSWTIPAPAPSLAPGAAASFNSAEINVPSGGEYLTITPGQRA